MHMIKIDIDTIDDLLSLKETADIEFKAGLGKDGKGKVPNSLWETYSAFANTDGGYIFLGVEEASNKKIKVVGIKDYDRVKQDLYNQANNSAVVSSNLLDNDTVKIVNFNGKRVIQIYIPKAGRKIRPVYAKQNPLKGSYIRRNEGDYLLDNNKVEKMLSERGDNPADSIVLKGFDIDDLEMETINAYRNTFTARAPNHPFASKDIPEFLKLIGARGKDRESGNEGITLAGLLMFGKLSSILEEIPNYILDYQEQPDDNNTRWLDRVTTDGTWSGNVYDFYRKIYQKITSDLKVPFKLKQGLRVDDTPVHEALREAFVNSLIHADYHGRVSVLITKKSGLFSFRNPGLMRVPIEQALEGGDSDCRNPKLQKMFQFVGAGDQAGSGIPKIYQNWKQQHWRKPLIREKKEPEQTVFELHTVSLIDDNAIKILDERFGKDFRELEELQRIILAAIITEGSVNHKRILELTTKHPSDISRDFSKLTRDGFLVAKGEGRGTSYLLAKKIPETNLSSGGLEDNSGGLEDNSGGLENSSGGLNNEELAIEEEEVARPAKTSKKLARDKMDSLILRLCLLRPQSLDRLSNLLDRNPDFLRKTYITPMVKNNRLIQVKKDPNHPQQAYKTTKENKNGAN